MLRIRPTPSGFAVVSRSHRGVGVVLVAVALAGVAILGVAASGRPGPMLLLLGPALAVLMLLAPTTARIDVARAQVYVRALRRVEVARLGEFTSAELESSVDGRRLLLRGPGRTLVVSAWLAAGDDPAPALARLDGALRS